MHFYNGRLRWGCGFEMIIGANRISSLDNLCCDLHSFFLEKFSLQNTGDHKSSFSLVIILKGRKLFYSFKMQRNEILSLADYGEVCVKSEWDMHTAVPSLEKMLITIHINLWNVFCAVQWCGRQKIVDSRKIFNFWATPLVRITNTYIIITSVIGRILKFLNISTSLDMRKWKFLYSKKYHHYFEIICASECVCKLRVWIYA